MCNVANSFDHLQFFENQSLIVCWLKLTERGLGDELGLHLEVLARFWVIISFKRFIIE